MYALPGQDAGDGAARRRARDRAAAARTCRTTSSRWNPTPCSPRGRRPAFRPRTTPGTCRSAASRRWPPPATRSTKSPPTRARPAVRAQPQLLALRRLPRHRRRRARQDHPRARAGEILRRWKLKNPRDYLARPPAPGRIGGDDPIAAAQRPFDYMLNALRLVEGFSLRRLRVAHRAGRERHRRRDLEHAQLMGWLEAAGDRVVPTELGRRFTNDVISLFLHD